MHNLANGARVAGSPGQAGVKRVEVMQLVAAAGLAGE